MDYGEVLSRAWRIIWKHKILWIFGILASCSSGNGSNSSARFNADGSQGGFGPSSQFERFFEGLDPALLTALIIAAVLIIVLLVILAILLSTIGNIALFRGAQRADRDLDTRLGFGDLFRSSLPYFWRMVLLSLLVFALTLVLVLAIVAVSTVVGIFTLGIGLLCLIPLFCLLIPFFIAVSVVVQQAQIAIVVEDLGVMDGLRRGWEVVRDNPVQMLVMWLILELAIGIIAGLIVALPLLLFLTPLIISAISTGTLEFNAMVAASLACVVIYLPVLILLTGAITSYIKTAWTLTFLRLTGRMAAPVTTGFAPVLPSDDFTAANLRADNPPAGDAPASDQGAQIF